VNLRGKPQPTPAILAAMRRMPFVLCQPTNNKKEKMKKKKIK
jgi:hypothetical protein